MSEILCKWLNEDIQLSEFVDPNNFAERFANGYLLGELLHRNGLQDDFELFSQLPTSETKLSNFTRIQPTMALLDIKFNTNMAQDIINQQPGVAQRLLYQLFISLGKKNKLNLTGVAMETMRPSAAARLGAIETDMYKERLKTLVPRQVDLDFDELVAKYNRKQQEQEEQMRLARLKEEEQVKRYQQDMRQKDLQRSRRIREQQDETMAKIKEATVKIPRPPEQKKLGRSKAEILKEKEVQSVYADINSFEKSLKNLRGLASPQSSDQIRELDADIEQFLSESPKEMHYKEKRKGVEKPQANDDYILKIRDRLNEDVNARKEREKRRRRVLIEQMKAHEAQQQFIHEEILVSRLMRQSQVERRIAVQLMDIRQQKDVIKQNRLQREQQYTERRLQDFQDALDREAEMAHQAKKEYEAEIQRAHELHRLIAQERAVKKYEKHYALCKDVALDIIDFSCKFGEYRELTDNLIPAKVVREWKTLFTNGKPLYEASCNELTAGEAEQIAFEESKQSLLDEEDFLEYQKCVGEWKPTAEDNVTLPCNNGIVGHILKVLDLILYPPTPPPPEPQFPEFPIKACVLGKCFAGKTSAIYEITQTHRLVSLSVDSTVHSAIQSYLNKECIEVPEVDILVPVDDSGNQVEAAITITEDEPKEVSEEANNNGVTTITPDESPPRVAVTETTPTPKVAPKNDSENAANVTPMPESSEMSIGESESTMKLTHRAKLGGKANTYLKKGKVIPDSLLVDIIVDHIQCIPDGTGWVLDGFPATFQQAKLLEKALTGYSPDPSPQKTGKEKKGKRSKIAADPHPPSEQKTHISGIDVLVLFDIPDDVALKRAEGRKMDPNTNDEYHEEFKPPPEGCYTGLQDKSQVRSVIDDSNDKEQIQIRLISYQDNWPKLEKWFNKFNIMNKIDANAPQEEVGDKLKDVFDQTLARLADAAAEEKRKLEEAAAALAAAQAEAEAKEAALQAEAAAKLEAAEMERLREEDEEKERPVSSRRGKKGAKDSPSPKKRGKESPQKKGKESPKKGKGKKDESPSPTKGKSASRTKSNESSKGKESPKRSRSRSKEKSNTSLPEIEVEAEEPPKPPPSPEPGSEEWVYVDQPIDRDFVEILLNNWNVIETTYISSSKHVFREIRQENETICRYFFDTKTNFIEFLKRPDEKQVFVCEWQKSYNSFPEDMRNDDEAKCELHQRVDDLCDRLWDICDNRKDEAEKECKAIMNEHWLEDHVGIIINHFLSLMQCEVDRFQATCKLLKDYYISMEGGVGPQKLKLISEGPPNFTRLPLVDIPPTTAPLSLEKSVEEDLSPSSSAQGNKVKTPEPVGEDKKATRIPLIPRTGVTNDTSPSRGDKKKSGAGKKESKIGIEEEVAQAVEVDCDEKLLQDAAANALHFIDVQTKCDLADEEADSHEKAHEKAHAELTKTVSNVKGKGKKGEKGAKTPSKMSKMNVVEKPSEVEPVDSVSTEEEKEKKALKLRMSKEYKKAVQIEGDNLKLRVEEIKCHSVQFTKKLKRNAQRMYTNMDDWLGKRFQEEMDSIQVMCEVLREAIEEERQLQDASVLEDKEFFIDDDLHVFKTPTPEPLPSPREDVLPDVFTCVQLAFLAKQFKEISPDGFMSVKSFITVLLDLQLSPAGQEILPEKWMLLTNKQVEQLASILSIENAYLNWKSFILLVTSPYPIPLQSDLLDALSAYRNVDVSNSGQITREAYNETQVWLDQGEVDFGDLAAFDRIRHLKDVIFDIFCAETSEGYLLDYQEMLMFFCPSADACIGLMNALAVVTGKATLTNLLQKDDEIVSNAEKDTIGESNPEEVTALVPNPQEDSALINNPQQDGVLISNPQADNALLIDPPDVTGEVDNADDSTLSHEILWSTEVQISDWLQVFNHCKCSLGGNHRFDSNTVAKQQYSPELVSGVYSELGYVEEEPVSLQLLNGHPIMQEIIDCCTEFEQKDISQIFYTTDEYIPGQV